MLVEAPVCAVRADLCLSVVLQYVHCTLLYSHRASCPFLFCGHCVTTQEAFEKARVASDERSSPQPAVGAVLDAS